MDDDDVQSVHEAARIVTVEQRPAQAQHQEHHQQWYDTLMDQAASAGVSCEGGGSQSLEEVWTFPVRQKCGLASSGAVIGAVDTGRIVQVHNTLTLEQEPRTHHIHHDIHDTH